METADRINEALKVKRVIREDLKEISFGDLEGLADPVMDIGMRLGEGTGAMVAYPLLCAALAFMNEMASFESAGVSKNVR